PQMLQSKKKSIGKPVKDGCFEIDPANSELLYYGENIFGGYAEHAGDLASYLQVQPLRTGDLASMDSDGYYYIHGRLKRIIKLFGTRINLDEIERSLNKKFEPSAFICTGMNDNMLLIGMSGHQQQEKTVTRFLFDEFGIHHSVVRIRSIDEIPLTENSKINYSKFAGEHGRG